MLSFLREQSSKRNKRLQLCLVEPFYVRRDDIPILDSKSPVDTARLKEIGEYLVRLKLFHNSAETL